MPRLIADRPVLRMTSELGRVMAAARARELAGERILHMERGEPDFDTPPHIVEALARAARDGFTHYPDQRGEITLREALAQKLARENGLTAHVDDIVVTAGGTHGLYLAMQCLLSPGDELLVLSPHWMAIPKLVAFATGATMRSLSAYLDIQSGALSPDGFAEKIRGALKPETRGVYVNTPNNPTGVVLDRAYLEALAKVAIEKDLWVISDEAYEHLLYDGAKHVSLASLPGMAERTIVLDGFSKTFSMTGWRLGFGIMEKSLAVHVARLMTNSNSCTASFIQRAGQVALTGPQGEMHAMVDEFRRRRDVMVNGLNQIPGVRCLVPPGAFYVFPNISGTGMTSKALATALLEEAGVACLAGTSFGVHGEGFLRFSTANSLTNLEKALHLVNEYLSVRAKV